MAEDGRKTCPECGQAYVLYEFDDNQWGCDNCGGVFTISPDELSYPPAASRPGKDEFGNDVFPESVL